MPAHLDEQAVPRAAIDEDAAAVLDDLRDVEPAPLRAGMEVADDVLIRDEEPDVEAVGVRLGLALPPLEDEREPLTVREDGEGGRAPARLEPESEQLFEERDRALNVGDLEIEVIELHGWAFPGARAPLRRGTSPRGAGIKGSRDRE